MFDFRLRLLLIVITFFSLLVTVRISKKVKMELSDAINWFFVAFFLTVSAVFPEILIFASSIMGIETASNAVFAILIFLLLVIVFYQNIKISRTAIRLKEITQKLSILEKNVRDHGMATVDPSPNDQEES